MEAAGQKIVAPSTSDRALDEAKLLEARCCFPLSMMKRLFRESCHEPDQVLTVIKQAIEDTCAGGPPPDVAGQLIAEQIAVSRGWKPPRKLEPLEGFKYDGSPEAEFLFQQFLDRARTAHRISTQIASHAR